MSERYIEEIRMTDIEHEALCNEIDFLQREVDMCSGVVEGKPSPCPL